MPIEFSLCIICVNHFSCQEIHLCTFKHGLTHNHDAYEVLLVENLQCNTEGVTTPPPPKQNLVPRFHVPSVEKEIRNKFRFK